jgi:hypothetical protein
MNTKYFDMWWKLSFILERWLGTFQFSFLIDAYYEIRLNVQPFSLVWFVI